MLQLTWFEFFVRLIPESFFIVLAVHAFSRQKIKKTRYILSSFLFAILTFCIRMLPIRYGIHTFILLVIFITITHYINEIGVMVSIRANIITVILLFVYDMISFFISHNLLHIETNIILGNVYVKTLSGIPSLILLIIISILSYYALVIKQGEKML